MSSILEQSKEIHVTASDKEKLLVLKIVPNSELDKDHALVIIPGFLCVTTQWSKLLQSLSELGYTIYIIETREKTSSTATANSSRYSLEGYAQDLDEVLEALKLSQPYSLIGISLGAGLIIYYLTHYLASKTAPEKVILIDAIYTSEHMNRAINFSYMPRFLFQFGMKFLIRSSDIIFRKLRLSNPDLYERRVETLKNADIPKVQKSLQSAKGGTVFYEIPFISQPALVLCVHNDKEHPFEQALTISQHLQDCRFIDMHDDETLHDYHTAFYINQFLMDG